MKFTKMHGCGNDYVYMDCTKEDADALSFDPAALSIQVSDRHFGIGSDGLILICSSRRADFRMRMFNADGSEAEMCGNGIRCVAKYVFDHKLTDQTDLSVETAAGIKYLKLNPGEDGLIETVRVDMGEPILEAAKIPVISDNETVVNEPIVVDGKEYRMTCVSMGNPHAVVFVDSTREFPLDEIGPKFECHERFPKRVNTEFVELISDHEVNMRVWERGSGETLACGTGTCASVMACILNHKTGNQVLVHLLGGDLFIEYDVEQNRLYMTGPATTVFEGEFESHGWMNKIPTGRE